TAHDLISLRSPARSCPVTLRTPQQSRAETASRPLQRLPWPCSLAQLRSCSSSTLSSFSTLTNPKPKTRTSPHRRTRIHPKTLKHSQRKPISSYRPPPINPIQPLERCAHTHP